MTLQGMTSRGMTLQGGEGRGCHGCGDEDDINRGCVGKLPSRRGDDVMQGQARSVAAIASSRHDPLPILTIAIRRGPQRTLYLLYILYLSLILIIFSSYASSSYSCSTRSILFNYLFIMLYYIILYFILF